MIRVKFRFGTANRKEMSWMSETSALMDTLRQEGVSPDLLRAVEEYRTAHPLAEALRPRIPSPAFVYYGREVWEQALAALLCGENLLLAGGKATGKNVLAENLAAAFGRPAWDISFHVNMDAASLIGMDTFEGGQVKFRPGPVYRCAQSGGFGVLDEVNMAKNEALVSRFVVVDMPVISDENLQKLLRRSFPTLKREWAEQLTALFRDLRTKCDSGEISTKALDLRGLLAALHLIEKGIPSGQALDLGIINKAFEPFERQLVADAVWARLPRDATRDKLFD